MRDLRWENVDSSLCRSRNLRSLHAGIINARRFTGLCSRNLRIYLLRIKQYIRQPVWQVTLGGNSSGTISYQKDQRESIRNFDKRNIHIYTSFHVEDTIFLVESRRTSTSTSLCEFLLEKSKSIPIRRA
ncbi:hypothetical protein ALC60_09911 [Trachymyrmex zeteki]|uniref:Uncharacterized protein n=1 Tax=Mycetomoellerius zeteki TaxID=64791 RepID=A0A151WT16_9HYME|nr:hypothetical protein ALC60_09911 [Trachymyrmex zeteki]